MRLSDTFAYTERTLTKEVFAVQMAVPAEYLDFEAVTDRLTGDLIARIKRYVWTEQRSNEIKVPEDWLEAVKERWAPAWFLRRYPVRYRSLVADLKVLYPDFTPAHSKHAAHLRIYEAPRGAVFHP